jgi:hypothetical protein
MPIIDATHTDRPYDGKQARPGGGQCRHSENSLIRLGAYPVYPPTVSDFNSAYILL